MQKELKKYNRLPIVGYWWLLMGCCALAACSGGVGGKKEVPAISVRTQIIQPATMASVNRYVGTVEAVNETPLSLQTAGRVLTVQCKNGDYVRRGQVLLRVDSTQAVNALRSAEATLRFAEDGFNRLKQVHSAGAVTDQKMVEAESQLAQARSLCDAARRQVRECELVAPCEGVVSGLDIAVGQTVIPGLQLLTILDMKAFQVRFTVPETEICYLQAGQKGEMECAAVQRTYPIQLTDRGLTANRLAHTYEVKAHIEGGQDILRPGMVCKVSLKTSSQIPDSTYEIVIPARCVLLMPQGPTVWLTHGDKAERVNIQLGGYRADGVLVTAGLCEGDTLITDGYQKLYQDCKIIIENEKE